MSTTSRRLSAKSRVSRPSHTPGKTKGGNCVKSSLKTWGMNANPNKLKGGDVGKYAAYCSEVDSYKGNERSK